MAQVSASQMSDETLSQTVSNLTREILLVRRRIVLPAMLLILAATVSRSSGWFGALIDLAVIPFGLVISAYVLFNASAGLMRRRADVVAELVRRGRLDLVSSHGLTESDHPRALKRVAPPALGCVVAVAVTVEVDGLAAYGWLPQSSGLWAVALGLPVTIGLAAWTVAAVLKSRSGGSWDESAEARGTTA